MNDSDIIAAIKGLSADSRQVRAGWLFAAIAGKQADGAAYITAAVENGATHVLAPTGTRLPDGIKAVLICDENVRRRFALLAAAFYKNQPAQVAAITGTNGKTSTATFVAQLWQALGCHAASIGTLGVRARNFEKSGGLTTPDPVTLHQELKGLYEAGVTHVGMEASSIGIEQCRLDGVALSGAAFTNLTHDHLDYHGTMEAYYEAKLRLFTKLLPRGAPAVIYTDDPYGEEIAKAIAQTRRVIKLGRKDADIRIVSQTPTPFGQDLQVEYGGQTYAFSLPLVGLFQGLNALVAAGLVMGINGCGFDALVPCLQSLHGVPGRLQRVQGHKKGAAVYVDYAHTPDGLETVLKALRPHTQARLYCVFGCGGDRDRTKRPIMGAIAAKLSDIAIITDDNPRSEDPVAIRAEIAKGAPQARIIGDRKTAIYEAVSSLDAGDVLVIAGKGHEQGQTVGGVVHPFDDVKEAEGAIHAL